MQYDYSKLIGRMAELGMSKQDMSANMHMSRATLYQKLKSTWGFSQNEIESGIQALGLDKKDIPLYFFTHKNSESKTKQRTKLGMKGETE